MNPADHLIYIVAIMVMFLLLVFPASCFALKVFVKATNSKTRDPMAATIVTMLPLPIVYLALLLAVETPRLWIMHREFNQGKYYQGWLTGTAGTITQCETCHEHYFLNGANGVYHKFEWR
jgi:asparagine N-glycosylation enzyme membrane subunit Stt3